MSREFEGNVVLVVGASCPLGVQTSKLLVRHGASVVLASRSNMDPLVEELNSTHPGRACYVHTDVTKKESWENLMNTITERHDRLDCALNCAGEATEHPSIAPLAELTDEDFEKALSVNVWGVIWGMQAEIKMMMKNKKGTIVNVSSTFTQRPIPYLGPHIMTKMAVEGLSKSAALEYANCGIRINTLDVGPTVDSDSLRNFVAAISQRSGQSCSDVAREFESHLPTGKYLCDDDVANSALWLLSGWSKGVLGHSLVIDNGFSSH